MTEVARLPPISRRQLRLFLRYLSFYLRRNFHGLHVLRLAAPEQMESLPLLVCMNHPSWWDPVVALYLSGHYFPRRSHYGPIEARGVAKYKFLEKLGMFAIDKQSRAGAVRFLQVGQAVLSSPEHALWVNPQGYFTDVRRKPVVFEAGVGHLAHKSRRFAMLPLAFEYAFWNERRPEAFACFGQPMLIEDGREHKPAEWNALFASALEAIQDILAERVQCRDPKLFEPLLAGRAGVGGIYDLWRASNARLRGKPWRPEHGNQRP